MFVCIVQSLVENLCRTDPLSLIDASHIFPVVEKVISFFVEPFRFRITICMAC